MAVAIDRFSIAHTRLKVNTWNPIKGKIFIRFMRGERMPNQLATRSRGVALAWALHHLATASTAYLLTGVKGVTRQNRPICPAQPLLRLGKPP